MHASLSTVECWYASLRKETF